MLIRFINKSTFFVLTNYFCLQSEVLSQMNFVYIKILRARIHANVKVHKCTKMLIYELK